jgi:hypothetical protein
VLEHHAHSPLPQLLRIPAWSGHGSNLSRVGASTNPGAVQGPIAVLSTVLRGACRPGPISRKERPLQSMPAPTAPVTVGVDTHLDLHVAAVLDHTGRLLAS